MDRCGADGTRRRLGGSLPTHSTAGRGAVSQCGVFGREPIPVHGARKTLLYMNMEREEIEKHIKILKEFEKKLNHYHRSVQSFTGKKKTEAKDEYYKEQLSARNYISMNLRDFIFNEKRSDNDINLWMSELPVSTDVYDIKKRLIKKLETM